MSYRIHNKIQSNKRKGRKKNKSWPPSGLRVEGGLVWPGGAVGLEGEDGGAVGLGERMEELWGWRSCGAGGVPVDWARGSPLSSQPGGELLMR